jgi:hypothetical protein
VVLRRIKMGLNFVGTLEVNRYAVPRRLPLSPRTVCSELIGSPQRPSPPDRKSQVLLKVDVQGDVGPDDVAEWKEWLSVELVAPSNSMTLTLVVKMSIPLWDFLQDRPAYVHLHGSHFRPAPCPQGESLSSLSFTLPPRD